MENHGYGQIIGNPAAPFINDLARRGALFTRSYAITHPSQPNYLALFSGSTQGIADDGCPNRFTAPNLATGLIKAGQSFACVRRGPARAGIAAARPGTTRASTSHGQISATCPARSACPSPAFLPTAFARLPTVSFVIPNLCHDMHDCSFTAGDTWLRAHIGGYADWAMAHDSLLILTWDEDDSSQGNHIATIFAGQKVRPGQLRRADHPLRRPGHHRGRLRAAARRPAATATPITDIWSP